MNIAYTSLKSPLNPQHFKTLDSKSAIHSNLSTSSVSTSLLHFDTADSDSEKMAFLFETFVKPVGQAKAFVEAQADQIKSSVQAKLAVLQKITMFALWCLWYNILKPIFEYHINGYASAAIEALRLSITACSYTIDILSLLASYLVMEVFAPTITKVLVPRMMKTVHPIFSPLYRRICVPVYCYLISLISWF